MFWNSFWGQTYQKCPEAARPGHSEVHTLATPDIEIYIDGNFLVNYILKAIKQTFKFELNKGAEKICSPWSYDLKELKLLNILSIGGLSTFLLGNFHGLCIRTKYKRWTESHYYEQSLCTFQNVQGCFCRIFGCYSHLWLYGGSSWPFNKRSR